ncbi:hypothetical protein ACLGIH_01375 [Streptomyces sp. HMX87]|uniref:hypothetical protein n=1 Tax=Streptomyces sp. HMX87 TaxID=3390849 RepID=UPI003A86408B
MCKTSRNSWRQRFRRHGARDRDASFTVSVNLDQALAADKQVKNLNHQLARDQPHVGNYDVPEAVAWIAEAVQKAGDPFAHKGNRRALVMVLEPGDGLRYRLRREPGRPGG